MNRGLIKIGKYIVKVGGVDVAQGRLQSFLEL
jgi:hypothetical protein